jgi:hypothetical protein
VPDALLADQPWWQAALPPPDAWAGFPGLLLAALLCTLAGGAVLGRTSRPETRLVAGWGVLCLWLTLPGVLTGISLRGPAICFALLALASLALPWNRAGWRPVGRLALLLLPLWLVMFSLRASQVDTWLNLLPNAAYLVDHHRFPTLAGPDSHSFLPGAPYDTQFIAYLAALPTGQLGQATMSWFNMGLAMAAALLLARVLAPARAEHPPWWALAGGFLLAVPLNPAFTPRVSFAPYGEWPLAVTLLVAVWQMAEALRARRAGERGLAPLGAVALALAAMVNTKQSGPGLVLAFALPALLLALTVPGRRLTTAAWVLAGLVPAALLYALWHGFQAKAGVAELTLLPREAWNTGLVPQILRAMAHETLAKGAFFVLLLGVILAGLTALLRRDLSPRGTVLMLTAGTALLYNLYLLLTYIVHFPPEMALQPHSYARYNYHLGLAVMLGLVLLLRPWLARHIAAWPARRQQAGAAVMIALVPILPVALAPLLRFDFDPPQPSLRAIATSIAPLLAEGDHLGLVVPGDRDDAIGSALRGLLLFTPPRQDLVIRTTIASDPAEVAASARFVLTTCTPAEEAALLRPTREGWTVVARWRYPPRARAMLCRK